MSGDKANVIIFPEYAKNDRKVENIIAKYADILNLIPSKSSNS
jgi:hypothetical protein